MPSKPRKSATGSTPSIASPATPLGPDAQTSKSPKPLPASEPTQLEVQPSLPVTKVGGSYFSSVKKAREALKARAHETYEKLHKIIDMAAAAGDFETAAKYTWQLIEHTPKDEGESIIDESAAKPKQVERGPSGPVIQIGVKVGGIEQKQLPESVVIDVKPNE